MSQTLIDKYTDGRKNNYDLIRFLAATLVIYSHAYPLGEGIGTGDFVTRITSDKWNAGSLGVAIFFVISGFLITQSYARSNNILTFIKARFLRIYPALIVVVLLSTFLLGTVVTTLPVTEYLTHKETYNYLKVLKLFPLPWDLPGVFESNVYKNSVNGSLWTIPFEVLCYFVVALVGFLGLLRYRSFMIALFSLTLFSLFFYDSIWPSGYQILGMQFDTFLILFSYFSAGMMLFTFRKAITLNKWFVLFSFMMLYLGACYGGIKELFIFFGSYIVIYFAYTPIWKLSNFSKLGDFSYGLYIYAFPIQQLLTYLHGGKMNYFSNFIISFILTLIVSVLSWHFVEKRVLNLKKVNLVSHFLPMKFRQRVSKLYNIYLSRLDTIKIKTNWWQFAIIFFIFVVGFHYYNAKPTSVTFPYTKSQSIFIGGWQPQAPGENYRWIDTVASVQLSNPKNKSLINIVGFIPEEFKEVSSASIFVNDQKIIEQPVKNGEGFEILGNISTGLANFVVKIQFNAAHMPSATSLDQRSLSALINKIELK